MPEKTGRAHHTCAATAPGYQAREAPSAISDCEREAPMPERRTAQPRWISGEELAAVLPMRDAIDCLHASLSDAEPPQSFPRVWIDTPAGNLYLMPASNTFGTGV